MLPETVGEHCGSEGRGIEAERVRERAKFTGGEGLRCWRKRGRGTDAAPEFGEGDGQLVGG